MDNYREKNILQKYISESPYLHINLWWTLTCRSCDGVWDFLLGSSSSGSRPGGRFLWVRRLRHRNLALYPTLRLALWGQLAGLCGVKLVSLSDCAQIFLILPRWGEDCRLFELSLLNLLSTWAILSLLRNLWISFKNVFAVMVFLDIIYNFYPCIT